MEAGLPGFFLIQASQQVDSYWLDKFCLFHLNDKFKDFANMY